MNRGIMGVMVLVSALAAAQETPSDAPLDAPLVPAAEPEPAAPTKRSVLPNAVAFAVLGPAAVADVVLLAATRSAEFAALTTMDAVALALNLTVLLLNGNGALPQRSRVGPPGFFIWHAGTSTSRYYCARPGVTSCAQYDALFAKPPGDVVEFRQAAGYLGRYTHAELFPLGWTGIDNLLQGFGVIGSLGVGYSTTNVTVESPSGPSMPKAVVSADKQWDLALAWRYYFSFHAKNPHAGIGYAGVRAGAGGRIFDVDLSAQVPLPGSNRLYPVVGLDVSLPAYVKYFAVELSGSLLINAKPGPDEIAGYGDPRDPSGGATGFGYQLEAGFGGTIWGSVGYRFRVRHTRFDDRFFGAGQKWTMTTQGAASETYTTFFMGLTSAF